MSEKEKNEILNDHDMSHDEMEAVSGGGGVVIDWDAQCEATVENGSKCWGTDACYGVNVKYYRDKAKHGCSAAVNSRLWCSSNDRCSFNEVFYAECESDFIISSGDEEM